MENLIAVLERALPNVDFKNNKTLVSDGTLNSLAIVTLIVEISEAYNVEFPFEEMTAENFESFEQIKIIVDRIIAGC